MINNGEFNDLNIDQVASNDHGKMVETMPVDIDDGHEDMSDFKPAGFRPPHHVGQAAGPGSLRSLRGMWFGFSENLSSVDTLNGRKELMRLCKLLRADDPHDRTVLVATLNDYLARFPNNACAKEATACVKWLRNDRSKPTKTEKKS